MHLASLRRGNIHNFSSLLEAFSDLRWDSWYSRTVGTTKTSQFLTLTSNHKFQLYSHMSCKYLFLMGHLTTLLLSILVLFKRFHKNVDFSCLLFIPARLIGIWTWIVRVEGEHADHLTATDRCQFLLYVLRLEFPLLAYFLICKFHNFHFSEDHIFKASKPLNDAWMI